MLPEQRGGALLVEVLCRADRRAERARRALQARAVLRAHEHLRGRDARQLLAELGNRQLQHEHLARGDVRVGEARLLPVRVQAQGQEVVVLLLLQDVGLDHRSGGDDAGHRALDEALGQGRVLHLLADGHAEPLFHELADVVVHRVVGHAAHGRALLQAAVPPRQRQLQGLGHRHRVVKEHLVKVAQAIHQDAVLVLLLGRQVVLHHWGKGHGFLPHKVKCAPRPRLGARCAWVLVDTARARLSPCARPRTRSRSRRSSRRSRRSRPRPPGR